VAQPARRQRPRREDPPIDPSAWDRAYREARLRRYARLERARAKKHASARFWFVLALLLAASVFVTLTVWQQIERLFGL
jgi:hypothetical protein